MPYENRTVTRCLTTHTADDNDGSSVAVIRDDLTLEPWLDGAIRKIQLFAHYGAPGTSEHHITRDGIERASGLSGGQVTLENGILSCIMDMAPGAKIGLHRTESIDHLAILHGSVNMSYECDGETRSVELKAGDVMIQRGTTHGWEAGPQGMRFFTVMTHAKPVSVRVSGAQLKEFWSR